MEEIEGWEGRGERGTERDTGGRARKRSERASQ